MYISVNRHFINSNNCFAVYLRFARERVKRRFPISNVSANNIALSRATCKLLADQAGSTEQPHCKKG
jgi:hypothetical protein